MVYRFFLLILLSMTLGSCTLFNTGDNSEETNAPLQVNLSGTVSFPPNTQLASLSSTSGSIKGSVNFSTLRVWVNGKNLGNLDASGKYSLTGVQTSPEYRVEIKNQQLAILLKLLTTTPGTGNHLNVTTTAVVAIVDLAIKSGLVLKTSDVLLSSSLVQKVIFALENIFLSSNLVNLLSSGLDFTLQPTVQEAASAAATALTGGGTSPTGSTPSTTTPSDTTSPTTSSSTLALTLTAVSSTLNPGASTTLTVTPSGGASSSYSITLTATSGSLGTSTGTSTFSTTYTAPSTTGVATITGTLSDQVSTTTKNLALTISDSQSPTITSSNPASGTLTNGTITVVSVTFNETVLGVTTSTLFLRTLGNATASTLYSTTTDNIFGSLASSTDGTVWTFTPSTVVGSGTFNWGATSETFVLVASSAISDVIGNFLVANASISFQHDGIAPTIVSIDPASGTNAQSIASPTTILVTFSEPVGQSAITSYTIASSTSDFSSVIASSVALTSSTTLTITASWTFDGASDTAGFQAITLPTTGIQDGAGNVFPGTVIQYVD